ncbi:hypothetical protein CHLRE_11g467787v5 [Chlamydomonas reinhardtii]|uniref:Uncharacterized protein n=1 Tax=Chlamydomonas reinhardtii TaxID=3055 RepID=A0A2K3D810_CHLRE|nr:uncharacterized protein CHLRE_11g467787v5 [Chlamydomonas reinhardtii]PNW76667.1 hypothetical protein CHLRE_11g467787v5 [Chlamydomonas reinhardtii]
MEQVAANGGAVNPALINNNPVINDDALINNNGGEQEEEEGAAGSSSEEESEAEESVEESVEEEEVARPAPLALPMPVSMPAAPAPAGPVAEEPVPAAPAAAGAAAGTAAGPAAAVSCAPAAGLADVVAGLAEVVAELAALRVQESRPTMAHHAPATRARAAVVPDYNENGSGWRTVRPGALEAHDSALAYDADVWAERLLRAHAPNLLKCGGGVTYARALSVPRGPHTSTVWWHLGAYQDVSRQDRCWVELKNRGQTVLVKRPGANGSVPLPVRDALDIQRVARQLYDLMKEVARHNGGVDSDSDRDDGGRRGRGLGGGGGDGAGARGVDAVTMAELIAQVRSLTAEVAQLKTAASQAPAAAGVAR